MEEIFANYASDEEQEPPAHTKQKRKLESPESDDHPTTHKKHKTLTHTLLPEKKEKLPPLPSFFFDEKEVERKELEERKMHKGKIRSFPHIQGNFPAFVYIPVSCEGSSELTALVTRAFNIAKEKHSLNIEKQEEYHISLSRTFTLREHHIELFVHNFIETFHQINFPRFDVTLGHYEYYVNDEMTRSFLSINISEGREEICELISQLDKVLAQFKLPVFYQDPKPHLTIGWTLGNVKSSVPDISGPLISSDCKIAITQIHCKIGKRIYTVKLL